MKWISKLYNDYFKVFSEDNSKNCTERNPEFKIFFYRGLKRRKLISIQQTS